MMLHKDTPYKVLKYLAKLSTQKIFPVDFQDENFILYLIDRQFLKFEGKQFSITKKFEEKYSEEIDTVFSNCRSFIEQYKLSYLENYYSIQEFEALIKIEHNKQKIIEQEISLQNILAVYFGSSKHRSAQSNLSRAIKTILEIEFFPEESKDQQYISILYPKNETRFIVLCENKNRLINPRHDFIEYWYAGGKNIKQLQFIPKPKFAIFYLFDWDYDGLEIYIRIKQNYFPTIKAFIPINPELIMVKQDEIKNHHSKWKDNKFLNQLNEKERTLVEILIKNDSVIEEQNIQLINEDLPYNLFN
jgi:hypothetical protein